MFISRTESGVAVGAGIAGVAGSFAVAGRTPAFVGAPISSAVVDLTPGVVVTAAIQTLGDWGHRLVLALALGLAVGLFAAVALVALRVGNRSEVPYTSALLAGGVGWALATAMTGVPGGALGVAVPLGAAVGVGERVWRVGRDRDDELAGSASRRTALAALAGLTGFVGIAAYRGNGVTGVEPGTVGDVTDAATQAEADRLLEVGRERSLDVSGITGTVSTIDDFYEVDINNVDPNPSDDEWELSVTGEVERELSLSFTDLTDANVEHRFETLRCVGEPLNGHKMDTALWTGVPVAPLLDRAGADAPENCCVMVRAVDDYYEEFPRSALDDGLLAFGMNGRRLPRSHGYPVRLLVPGHWGEINVKWVSEIEVLDEEQTGYWEKRGWHGTGPVNTVAKLHTVNHREDGRIEVGGHAYAGTRGIRTVEVSTDAGETWDEATLSERLPGADTWRQWRYEWDPDPGTHEVVVRSRDGDGKLQPRESSRPYPSGATGWVSRTVEA